MDVPKITELPPSPITVLQCYPGAGGRAAKFWRRKPDGSIEVSREVKLGKWFNVARTAPVGTIFELHELLRKLRRRKDCFIIRGVLRPNLDPSDVHAHREEFFSDVPGGLRWVLIDIDKVDWPVAIDPITDPDGAIRYLRDLLPPEFRDVACSWEFSASMGSGNGKLSVHLWFMLDRTMTDGELLVWAERANADAGYKLVDLRLFNIVQAHLVAPPIFKDGLHDPLPQRSGFCAGLDDVVSLPPLSALAQHRSQTSSRDRVTRGLDFREAETPAPRGFEGHMSRLGDGGGRDGFHRPITSAVASAVRHLGAEKIDREHLKSLVRDRIDGAPKGPGRSAADIVRYKSDSYLDGSIDGALEKFGGKRAEREAAAVALGAAQRERHPLPLNEAEAWLAETIDEFFLAALAWQRQAGSPRSLP